MLKSVLIASAGVLGLLAAPVMAAGTSATSPASASGKSSTMHHKATHVSTGTSHMTHSGRSSSRASSQDHIADRLNAQSLQAAMQGQPFGAGSPGTGGRPAGALPQPTPVARP